MNYEEFQQRAIARREARIRKEDLRAKRIAWAVLVGSVILTWWVIIISVWGVMA